MIHIYEIYHLGENCFENTSIGDKSLTFAVNPNNIKMLLLIKKMRGRYW